MMERMEDYFDVIEAGDFEDGASAFRLQVKSGFKIQGVLVPAGTMSMFRIDDSTELRASWMWGKGDIRSSQVDSTIIGRINKPMAERNIISNVYMSSCHIKTNQIAVKHCDLNDVNCVEVAVRFFGGLGTPERPLVLSKVDYALSVRMFGTTYSAFKEFTEKYV